MAVNLSIKNAPDALVETLRQRARRNHRSLQGELLSILEDASRQAQAKTLAEVHAAVRKLGLTPRSESARLVREDRDAR
jgi:antitoxin FitA